MDRSVGVDAPSPLAVERDGFIDAVRAGALLVVVVGHWLVTSVYWDDAGTRSVHLLSVVPALHPLTWITQVMPLVFFVGGFTNATVAARHPGAYLGYLRERLGRLLAPTVVFFMLWSAVGIGSHLLDGPGILDHAARVAAIPLWFLGIYLIVVAASPALYRAHERFGIAVPIVLAIGAVAGDAARLIAGIDAVAPLNYAMVWCLAHQLGYWYRDGRLTRRVAAMLMAAGITGLVVATTVGGYPVSMVGVPGEPRWNPDPPSLVMVALTAWLVGLVLLLRGPITQAWQRRGRFWAWVQRSLLTLYLWHVSAMALAVVVVYPLGFRQIETGTADWWAWRLPWVGVLTIAMALFVAVFGRFEVRVGAAPSPRATPYRVTAAALVVFSWAVAILGAGVTGFTDPFGPGRDLIVFSVTPLHNLAHLVIGLIGLWALFRPTRAGIVVPAMTAAILALLGWIGHTSPDAVSALGWNSATGMLHLVAGSVALLALATSATLQRSGNSTDPR